MKRAWHGDQPQGLPTSHLETSETPIASPTSPAARCPCCTQSPRERKYWDSGEYFMTKAGLAKMLDDVPFTPQQLEALPKLYN